MKIDSECAAQLLTRVLEVSLRILHLAWYCIENGEYLDEALNAISDVQELFESIILKLTSAVNKAVNSLTVVNIAASTIFVKFK